MTYNATLVMADNVPVISMDCKKKELIGNFKNAGTDWFGSGITVYN